jgi:putative FmdB family regulatory protein
MPTYVYRCDSCDHTFELFQKMSDDPIDICPECGARVRRVIHPVGIVFKGSGWYINDSKSANGDSKETPAAKADTSEPAKSANATDQDVKTTTKVSDGDAKSSGKVPTKAAAD